MKLKELSADGKIAYLIKTYTESVAGCRRSVGAF